MIGYTLLHVKNDRLEINCTNDMASHLDHCMSGRVWYDKELAADAAIHHNSFYDGEGPVYIAEVTLPDPR